MVDAVKILTVCTGNVCRSPMVAALLDARLTDLGVSHLVLSAGLVTQGQPASVHSVTCMAERGLDIGQHRSQLLSPELIAGADVIVALARNHVQEVVLSDPAAFTKTYTLKEIVRRAEAASARTTETVEAWLRRLHQGRTTSDLIGMADADDVADPIGRPLASYQKCAAEVEDLVDRLVTAGWKQAAA